MTGLAVAQSHPHPAGPLTGMFMSWGSVGIVSAPTQEGACLPTQTTTSERRRDWESPCLSDQWSAVRGGGEGLAGFLPGPADVNTDDVNRDPRHEETSEWSLRFRGMGLGHHSTYGAAVHNPKIQIQSRHV